MKKIIISLFAVLFVITICTPPVATAAGGVADYVEEKKYCKATIEDEFADDCVLVTIKKAYSEINKQHYIEDFDSVEIEEIVDLTYVENYDSSKEYAINENDFHQILKLVLKEKGKLEVLRAISLVEELDIVLSAGPNYIFALSTNDYQSYSNDFESGIGKEEQLRDNYTWGLSKIQTYSAWNITEGSNNIKVGILDTGIDYFSNSLTSKIDTSLSHSFINSSALTDPNGHGTHIAGIVGASQDSTSGMSGVCKYVSLVSLQVANSSATAYLSDVISAITYAGANNIRLLNYSYSGTSYDSQLIFEINNYSGLFVCSAGNDGNNIDLQNNKVYPPSYKTDNMISVANMTSSDELASDSNYGANTIHLAAPGTSIYSTLPNSNYGYMSGTSMAAPFVTGVAALIKSINPNFTTQFIKQTILNNVTTASWLDNKCITEGYLNAYNAVSAAVSYTNNFVTAFDNAWGLPGNVRITGWAFDWRAPGDSLYIHAYIGGPSNSSNAEGHNLGATFIQRDAVNSTFGITGNHGYDFTMETAKRGSQEVYVYAINNDLNSHTLIGHSTVNIPTGSPVTSLATVSGQPGKVRIAGWAFDYDAPDSSIQIHAYVGGSSGSSGAEGHNLGGTNVLRSDVNSAYGLQGNHGFDFTFNTNKRGSQEVYIYAMNVGNGSNVCIGHMTADIPTGNPLGSIDSVTNPQSGVVNTVGWAFDYDAPSTSIQIHVYIGGPSSSSSAEGHNMGGTNMLRSDVNSLYNLSGNHGFQYNITTSKQGTQEVYIYAINVGNGTNVCLGHRSVVIS